MKTLWASLIVTALSTIALVILISEVYGNNMQSLTAEMKKNIGKKCIICGAEPIEVHHCLYYQGRQMSEPFAIVELCKRCHRGNNGTIWQDVREICEMKALNKGLIFLMKHYPKTDWWQRLIYLQKKYEGKRLSSGLFRHPNNEKDIPLSAK